MLMTSSKQIFIAFGSDAIDFNRLLEIANFYRFIFNNANRHYLLFPTEDRFISPAEFFQCPDNEYVSLDKMDSIGQFPVNPLTGEEAIFWHDPLVTFNKLYEILKKRAYVSTVRDYDNKLIGVAYAYIADLKRIFFNEWSHKHCYAKKQFDDYRYDFDEFNDIFVSYFKKEEQIIIKPDAEFICWNCTALDKACRGINIIKMLHKLFSLIHDRNAFIPRFLLMEVSPGGKVYDLCIHFKAKEIPGLLKNGSIFLYFHFDSLMNSISDMKRRLDSIGR